MVGKFCGRFPLLINLDPSQSLVYGLLGKPPDTQDQQHTVKYVCHSFFLSLDTSGQSGVKSTRSHFVFPAVFFKALLDGKQDVPASCCAQSLPLKTNKVLSTPELESPPRASQDCWEDGGSRTKSVISTFQ